ncbi:MAG: hypothetical protein M3388_05025 [Acidobacteriota bacterium]|nr:hypothetical protein [Acidobacteriota bacterium]
MVDELQMEEVKRRSEVIAQYSEIKEKWEEARKYGILDKDIIDAVDKSS